MRMLRLSVLPFAAVACLLAGSTATEAAVRVCDRMMVGNLATAATETEARRGAISSWRRKVAALRGVAFTSWRLAMGKKGRCGRLKDGRTACVVVAVPCRISQVPPRPGLKPDLGPLQPRPSPPAVPPRQPPQQKPRPSEGVRDI